MLGENKMEEEKKSKGKDDGNSEKTPLFSLGEIYTTADKLNLFVIN